MDKLIFRPQKGKQEKFLASSADIVIYGGAAGGGKSYALLLEPLRHVGNPQFAAVTFRKTNPQILSPGGLWAESFNIYLPLGATPKLSPKPMWKFPNGATITFSHLEMEQSKYDWQGSQIPLIMFDELTHFSESVFFYMLSRNRSTCGVQPYVRATCNPDADSWVAKFIAWWIDQDTGYPIEERCGKVRWFVRRDEAIHFADKKQELWERFGLSTDEEREEPRSAAFINSTLQDNKILMEHDPSYMANLKALPTVERERLLYGNWKIKPAAGLFFQRTQVGDMLPIIPADVVSWVRSWDLAATSESEGGDPAYTSSVLMGKRSNGRYIVADVVNLRLSASDVRATIKHTAATDNARFNRVTVRLPKDPGQAGKDQAESMIRFLAGYNVKAIAETGSKETRAEPVAAQWQGGNFDIVVSDWNEMYFAQLESFPASKYKDMVDATSSAFAELVQVTEYDKLIYNTFDYAKHTYSDIVIDKGPDARRYIAVNYGTVTPMSFLELIDNGDIVYIDREYYYSAKEHDRQKSDIEYADDFVRFSGSTDDITSVVLNEKAVTFKNELRNRGYRVRNAYDDERNDIEKVRVMFDLDKLLINRECNRLIDELYSYIWDEKAAEHGEERPLKMNDYACDALRYGIATVVYTKRRFAKQEGML